VNYPHRSQFAKNIQLFELLLQRKQVLQSLEIAGNTKFNIPILFSYPSDIKFYKVFIVFETCHQELLHACHQLKQL